MTIIILPSAKEDLAAGFAFLKNSKPDWGPTSWSLCSRTLTPLKSTWASIAVYSDNTGCFPSGSLSRSIIRWNQEPLTCEPFWIVGETLYGSASGWGSSAFLGRGEGSVAGGRSNQKLKC